MAFPELSVTGYTCADLFGQDILLKKAEEGVMEIMEFSRGKSTAIIVGAPVPFRGRLYNCAIVLRNGNVKGIVPKIYLPTYTNFMKHAGSRLEAISSAARCAMTDASSATAKTA